MITGRQIRAARALIDMSQDDLAEATGLTPQSIRKIENGDVTPREGTIGDIARVFRERGLEFTNNSGVQFAPEDIYVYTGRDGFARFYDLIYQHIREHGGDICVSGVDESLFSKHRPDSSKHRELMTQLVSEREDISMRILIEEGDLNFTASTYAKYKWQKKEYFSPTSFYVFGEHLALISFTTDPSPKVIVIKSACFANSYRQSFNLAWDVAKEPAKEE